jgi:hypothetical protein
VDSFRPAEPRASVAERVQVREIDDDEGRLLLLLLIVRRGAESVVTWRRVQMMLHSAQVIPVA